MIGSEHTLHLFGSANGSSTCLLPASRQRVSSRCDAGTMNLGGPSRSREEGQEGCPQQEVVDRARSGDLDAVFELIEHCRSQILRAVRSGTKAPLLDAAEVASEARLKIARGISGYRGDGSNICSWMGVVARNAATELTRRELRNATRSTYIGTRELEAPVKPTQFEAVNDALFLESVLASLAPRERELLEMRYLEDLSAAEIGRRIGYNTGSTRRLISSALKTATGVANRSMRERSVE